MNSLGKFFEKFNNKGVQFVAIKEYVAKTTGEVSNFTINVGLSVEKAKQRDLKKLQSCDENQLKTIAKNIGIEFETCKKALNELTASAIKNLNPDIKKRSAGSQAQTNAYKTLCNGLKVLSSDYENLLFGRTNQITGYVFGQRISKTVLIKGTYKTVNSSAKTIAKNEIKKALNLTSHKFRNFIIPNITAANLQGETLEF